MVSDGSTVSRDFGCLNKYEMTKKGSRVAILGLGTFYHMGSRVCKLLSEKYGIDATLINPYYISGLDAEMLNSLKDNTTVVATIEDSYLEGGFGEKIARFYGSSDMKVLNFGFKKEFLDRYNVWEVMKENHMTPELIVEDIMKVL